MPRNEPGALSPGSELGAFLEVFLVTGASCATGRRDHHDAASACEFLARPGFPYVSHVVGGILAWMRGGYGRSTGSP